jgi:8-oxo-dGTP diphosphatase
MSLTPSFERQLLDAATDAGVDRLVVGVVIRRHGRALLLRRKHDDFMGGLYELPSGVVEPGETLEEALHREVMEETGLLLAEVERYLGSFDYASRRGRTTRQFNFLVAVADFPGISLSEHDAFIWAEPSDLDRLLISDALRQVLGHPSLLQVRKGILPRQTGGPA